jgi:hypothetical protein
MHRIRKVAMWRRIVCMLITVAIAVSTSACWTARNLMRSA